MAAITCGYRGDEMKDFCIVQTHPQMLSFVDMLQRKNAEQLSFYPMCVFEREHKAGRLFMGLLNGDPCGYIYVGATGSPTVKCHQVCIEYDARRSLYGARLVVAMEAYAIDGGSTGASLRCGFDLEANNFWESLGYTCVNVVNGGVRRMRRINVWRKQLKPELFADIGVQAEVGKTSATVWSKHKSTGIVNQFSRGKTLSDYRAIVIKDSGK